MEIIKEIFQSVALLYGCIMSRVRWVVEILTWGIKISLILSKKYIFWIGLQKLRLLLEKKVSSNLKLAKHVIHKIQQFPWSTVISW